MKAKLILGALERSGYIMTVGAIIQLVSSLLYLANRFVTVANLLILPTIFNLLLFSVFLEPMAFISTTYHSRELPAYIPEKVDENAPKFVEITTIQKILARSSFGFKNPARPIQT